MKPPSVAHRANAGGRRSDPTGTGSELTTRPGTASSAAKEESIIADLDGLRLDGIDGGDTVRSLLAALPENERAVLLLRIFHSQRPTRIAERLGITPVDVTRLLATSLARLRDQLPQG